MSSEPKNSSATPQPLGSQNSRLQPQRTTGPRPLSSRHRPPPSSRPPPSNRNMPPPSNRQPKRATSSQKSKPPSSRQFQNPRPPNPSRPLSPKPPPSLRQPQRLRPPQSRVLQKTRPQSMKSTTKPTSGRSTSSAFSITSLVGNEGCVIPFGTWGGIPMSIHFSFVVLGLIMTIIVSIQHRSWKYSLMILVVYFPILFLTALLHEFGHAYRARSFGGVCEKIVVWPLGGMVLARVPQGTVREEFWVALTGPVSHIPQLLFWLLIMIIASDENVSYLTRELRISTFDAGSADVFFAELARSSFLLNCYILAVNIFVPAFPLDSAPMWAAVLIEFGIDVVVAAFSIGVTGAFFSGLMVLYGFIALIVENPITDPGWFFLFLGIYLVFTSVCLLFLAWRGDVHRHPIFELQCYRDAYGGNPVGGYAPLPESMQDLSVYTSKRSLSSKRPPSSRRLRRPASQRLQSQASQQPPSTTPVQQQEQEPSQRQRQPKPQSPQQQRPRQSRQIRPGTPTPESEQNRLYASRRGANLDGNGGESRGRSRRPQPQSATSQPPQRQQQRLQSLPPPARNRSWSLWRWRSFSMLSKKKIDDERSSPLHQDGIGLRKRESLRSNASDETEQHSNSKTLNPTTPQQGQTAQRPKNVYVAPAPSKAPVEPPKYSPSNVNSRPPTQPSVPSTEAPFPTLASSLPSAPPSNLQESIQQSSSRNSNDQDNDDEEDEDDGLDEIILISPEEFEKIKLELEDYEDSEASIEENATTNRDQNEVQMSNDECDDSKDDGDTDMEEDIKIIQNDNPEPNHQIETKTNPKDGDSTTSTDEDYGFSETDEDGAEFYEEDVLDDYEEEVVVDEEKEIIYDDEDDVYEVFYPAITWPLEQCNQTVDTPSDLSVDWWRPPPGAPPPPRIG